jgi:hypothetical protein
MAKAKARNIISVERIAARIYLIRGQKVMLAGQVGRALRF